MCSEPSSNRMHQGSHRIHWQSLVWIDSPTNKRKRSRLRCQRPPPLVRSLLQQQAIRWQLHVKHLCQHCPLHLHPPQPPSQAKGRSQQQWMSCCRRHQVVVWTSPHRCCQGSVDEDRLLTHNLSVNWVYPSLYPHHLLQQRQDEHQCLLAPPLPLSSLPLMSLLSTLWLEEEPSHLHRNRRHPLHLHARIYRLQL